MMRLRHLEELKESEPFRYFWNLTSIAPCINFRKFLCIARKCLMYYWEQLWWFDIWFAERGSNYMFGSLCRNNWLYLFDDRILLYFKWHNLRHVYYNNHFINLVLFIWRSSNGHKRIQPEKWETCSTTLSL